MTQSALDLHNNLVGYVDITLGKRMPDEAWQRYCQNIRNCITFDGNAQVNAFIMMLRGMITYHDNSKPELTDKLWRKIVNQSFRLTYDPLEYHMHPTVKRIHKSWDNT